MFSSVISCVPAFILSAYFRVVFCGSSVALMEVKVDGFMTCEAIADDQLDFSVGG